MHDDEVLRRIIWVLSTGASPSTLTAVLQTLTSRQLPFRLVEGPQQVRPNRSRAAVVVGGFMGVPILDTLRPLAAHSIPTLLLVEELTDHQESLLLGAGAFDVVGLPTSFSRLSSRIGALHRNSFPARPTLDDGEEVLQFQGDLELWPERRQVFVAGTEVSLTKSEFDLLLVLAQHRGRVLTRDEILDGMTDPPVRPRGLESHVSRLRGKVLKAGGPRLIEPVRGVGYRLS